MAAENPWRTIRDDYVFFKDNLITHTTLIDELLARNVLSDVDKADYRKVNNIKCGKLIKEILRKGPEACGRFLNIVQEKQYGCSERIRHPLPLEDDDLSYSKDFVTQHRTLLLEELESTKTADYLFQNGILDIDTHDEIEAEKSRSKKAKMILDSLKGKSPKCINIFVRVLTLSNPDILSMLQEEEKGTSKTPKEKCEECVLINFRQIRENLHFEITVDYLKQAGVLELEENPEESRIQRGQLVKKSIRKGSRGCESLLRCLNSQLKEMYEKILRDWEKKKGYDPRKDDKIDITLRKEDLTRHKSFFLEELEPLELSDILFEVKVLTVSEHDEIEEGTSLRRRRNETLLNYLEKKPEDKLAFFVYALMQSGKSLILEKIRNPQSVHEEPISAPSSSQIPLTVSRTYQLCLPIGDIPNSKLKVTIEEKNNPDSEIDRVVTFINNDPRMKIEVLQNTHMAIEHATKGSIVIHLCPLTDNAVYRFFSKDGSLVQNMVEKLFISAGLHELLQKRKELEIKVKISKKEPTPEEKVNRSQDPDDIMRRKMQENERTLVDELEPYQLMTYLIQKNSLTPEDKSEIERERGRKKRGIKLLQKIRNPENKEMLHSFINFLKDVPRDDLLEMVKATDVDVVIHGRAEKIRNLVLDRYKEIVEDLETNIMLETLQKFKDNHALEDEMNNFLPESGKSRAERALNFLTFVLKHDEYVIELENVLRQNNMGVLIPEEEMEEESVVSAPDEKTRKAEKPLKEGLLFDCTYRISLGKEEYKEEKAIEKVEENFPYVMKDDKKFSSTSRPPKPKYAKMHEPTCTSPEKEMHIEEDLPSTKKDDKEMSVTGPGPHKHAHLTKYAQCPTDETSQEDEKIVVAIDFGTTYSGFAYSRTKNSEIILQKWDPIAADKVDASLKTPTSLLLDDKNKFEAFGFKAEQLYKEYAEDGKHENFRFFRNFKMKLLKKESLGSSMSIEDHMGKPLAALEVFSKSLEYMKKKVLKKITEECEGLEITAERIHWIVTVPAIWDEFAKQFMREAAEKANIPSKQLRLALEPECAAVYVLTEAKMNLAGEQIEKKVGERMFVADLGGGTADFSVVEITEKHTLKHLHYASGGDWGGKDVNKEIFNIFERIFGTEVMKKFNDMKAEILQMENDIELKKRDLKTGDKLSFSVLPSLTSLCSEVHKKTYKEIIDKSMFKEAIECKRSGKICLDVSLVNRIFGTVVRKIADHMKSILAQQSKPNDIKTIILVGGFAKSDFVYECIKKEFSDKEVKRPTDPDLAVLKGAVKFGHFDGIIEMRVCNYTYGVETNRYRLATDPMDKIKYIGDKHQCTQVFKKMVTIGDKILVNDKVEKTFNASTSDMTKMKINIYRSKEKNPLFVTDKGCELFATMTIHMPDTKGGMERAVKISIEFGKTEITFSGKDENTGRGMKTTMEMIW